MIGEIRTADVIVVGLGAMGSAACFQLAARGVSVIGIDQYAPPHPWGSTHGDTQSEIERMYEWSVAPHLPWLGAEPLKTVSYLSTSTRGSRFVIDRHPEHDSVLIVSACSGHGFEHSPAIGEAVAQWLTGHKPDIDLRPFGFSQARR